MNWSNAGIFVMMCGWFCLFVWVSRAEPDPYADWPELPEKASGSDWYARTGPHDNMTEYEEFDSDYGAFALDDPPPKRAA